MKRGVRKDYRLGNSLHTRQRLNRSFDCIERDKRAEKDLYVSWLCGASHEKQDQTETDECCAVASSDEKSRSIELQAELGKQGARTCKSQRAA